MGKNIVIVAGVVISLVAVAVLFFDDSSTVNIGAVNVDKSLVTNNKVNDQESKIEYETTKKNTVTSKTVKKVERPKREKFVEAQTYDRSHKFEISLINPNQDVTKPSNGFKTLKGSIDGEVFFLKVPKKLIEEGSNSVQLRIKNVKTGTTDSVVAAFIDNMKNPSTHESIIISSEDIQNYEQKTTKQIVPPRPGEAVN
jgi:hypothetical protein